MHCSASDADGHLRAANIPGGVEGAYGKRRQARAQFGGIPGIGDGSGIHAREQLPGGIPNLHLHHANVVPGRRGNPNDPADGRVVCRFPDGDLRRRCVDCRRWLRRGGGKRLISDADGAHGVVADLIVGIRNELRGRPRREITRIPGAGKSVRRLEGRIHLGAQHLGAGVRLVMDLQPRAIRRCHSR